MRPFAPALGEAPIQPRSGLDRAIARAPRRSLKALVGRGPVFVLAPHPDDESIGCGGLIAACVRASVPVFVHFLTDGRHSHPGSQSWPPERIAREREGEALRAATLLGLTPDVLSFERVRDGALLFDWEVAERIALRIAEAAQAWPRPVILAPWRSDPHPDHMAAAVIADLVEQAHAKARGLRYLVWALEHGGELPGGGAVSRFAMARWRRHKRRALYAYRTQATGMIEDAPARTIPDLSRVLGRDEIYVRSKA